MPGTMDESHDASDSDTSTASQMPYTQPAFGTQIPHLARARSDLDEPQLLGVTPLEPVLAGNTQRVEIRPVQNSAMYEKLTTLLGPRQKPKPTTPSASSALGFVQSAFARPKSAHSAAEPAEQATESPSRSGTHHENARGALASPKPSGHPSKEVPSPLVRDGDAALGAGDSEANVVPADDTAVAPECSWMKGFIFNSEALKVPRLQEECLNKESSWLKPQPGCPPFQDGNMPQLILQTLHRMADELATEDHAISEDGSDVDPSPDSLPEGINLSAESVPQTTQDDDASSGVLSWDASPEPPQRPTNPGQGLPPNSSAETQALGAGQSKTKSSSLGKQLQHPDVIDISDDEPIEIKSSPPAVQAPMDSDVEMEMEESIPQALGEDLAESASPSMKKPAISSSGQTQPQSVVQVEETPDGKGKTANYIQDATLSKSNPEQAQNSSGESKHTSSTSIIYSTYDVPDAPSSAEPAQRQIQTNVKLEERSPRKQREERPARDAAGSVEHMPENSQVLDEPCNVENTADEVSVKRERQVSEALSIEATIPSAATPQRVVSQPKETNPETPSAMPHTVSGSVKRKLEISPAKSNRRHSKRREIKIVGFGDVSPVTIDPVAKLRGEREESLRRFRGQRNSSISSENLHEPTRTSTAARGPDAMDIDSTDTPRDRIASVARSPRHQSLYDEPSPGPAQSAQPRQSQPAQRQVQSRDVQSPKANNATENVQTVFQSFKAAYPEYKGDTNHFHNQCKQMYLLDLEDKMVPKWQWDDFIIRNRTDYRDHALECLDRGENAEPYYRFYKDSIRDTLYRKGIIQGPETLETALGEVGMAIEDLTLTEPPRTQLPSRKSLPSSFNQVRKPYYDNIAASHTRPRQSLPSSSHSHNHNRHQQLPSSVSRYAPLRQQQQQPFTSSRDPSPAPQPPARESTGDPFRDFYFGLQRSTSWTGSTKVSLFPPFLFSLPSSLCPLYSPLQSLNALTNHTPTFFPWSKKKHQS